jgi:anti-sigma regulatory factor (Ser/Thr protein kinase)
MARLADWLDQQESGMAIRGALAFAVRQCLEEAVANLINHTPPAAGDCCAVELDWQGDTLVATVEDHAAPFDLRTVPAPPRPDSLDKAVAGGWGIHLIRTYADDIAYETTEGRNRLTLRFAASANPS